MHWITEQLTDTVTYYYTLYVQINDRVYFEVGNNDGISQLSILLIIVGLFIMIVGAVGAVGAIFASTIFGRITLGLVSNSYCYIVYFGPKHVTLYRWHIVIIIVIIQYMFYIHMQYSVVLSLLVICEIAGGIAAAVKRGEVS